MCKYNVKIKALAIYHLSYFGIILSICCVPSFLLLSGNKRDALVLNAFYGQDLGSASLCDLCNYLNLRKANCFPDGFFEEVMLKNRRYLRVCIRYATLKKSIVCPNHGSSLWNCLLIYSLCKTSTCLNTVWSYCEPQNALNWYGRYGASLCWLSINKMCYLCHAELAFLLFISNLRIPVFLELIGQYCYRSSDIGTFKEVVRLLNLKGSLQPKVTHEIGNLNTILIC